MLFSYLQIFFHKLSHAVGFTGRLGYLVQVSVRTPFYVMYDQLDKAVPVVDELFAHEEGMDTDNGYGAE